MAFSTILDAFDRHPSVSTDTRKIQPGDLFFALKGDNFDGNQYAAKALEAGASAVVVDDPAVVPDGDGRYILVPDVLIALQESAREHRRRFSIPFIGITGSNGKTTTKELMWAVLATEKKVHATKGNLNNHIGVPLTLFAMPLDSEIAIIEMGANKLKDIEELAAIAEPSHGLITNIGRAHLEGFGSIEGVRITKGELFDHLQEAGGLAWVNRRDHRVSQAAETLTRTVDYGLPESPYHIVEIRPFLTRMELDIQMGEGGPVLTFESQLPGRHNAENILAAVTVGDTFGISHANLQKAIAEYVPSMNRTQVVKTGEKTVLLDAYNANPSSMEATLRSLAEQKSTSGSTALILGDMFELGDDSARMHRQLVETSRELLPDALLIGVGEEMTRAISTLGAPRTIAYTTTAEANEHIQKDLQGIEFVLIKGSRGMALEKLLPAIGAPQG